MTSCKCGTTWAGLRIEHCTACHETFTGNRPGEMHRTGEFFPLTRRCLSPDEMREKGMKNARGYWTTGQVSPWTQPPESAAASSLRSTNAPIREGEDA